MEVRPIRWLVASTILSSFAAPIACGESASDVASGRDASTGVGGCNKNCPDGVSSGDGWSSGPDADGAGATGGVTTDAKTGGTGGLGGLGGSGGTSTGGAAGSCGTTEICDNGDDDDCDDKTDCGDEACADKSCGPERLCKSSECKSIYQNAPVSCGNNNKTGTELCVAAGFQGCVDSIGYWWFQCAGPGDCPGAWSGLTCSSYVGASDCVGATIQGNQYGTSAKGCSTAYGATDLGYDCQSWNPGYNVRLKCN